MLTFKEADVCLALDDAMPLCPAAETLRRVRAAVAKGLRPHEATASSAQLEHSVIAAICSWACGSPRTQVASSVSSANAAESAGRGTAQTRRHSASLSAEPHRMPFACTLLRKLRDASPVGDTVDMHRSECTCESTAFPSLCQPLSKC